MHARRLNRIAHYLGSAGLYKEAYQIKKISQMNEDDLMSLQDMRERNEEMEDAQERSALRSSKLPRNTQDEELDLDQQGLETNNEFEDLFPSSPDEDENQDEDDVDSALSEYLDEEDMEPAGEGRFDDENFDPDLLLYSRPHDEADDEDKEPLSNDVS